jgi:hypothetical protein
VSLFDAVTPGPFFSLLPSPCPAFSNQDSLGSVIHLSWYCLKTPTLMSFDNSEWRSQRIDLLRFVRRRVNDAALREDIVQEAIIRLLVYRTKPGITIANIATAARGTERSILTKWRCRAPGCRRSTHFSPGITTLARCCLVKPKCLDPTRAMSIR